MRKFVGAAVVALVVAGLSVPNVAARTRAGGSSDAAPIQLLGYVPADVRGSCQIHNPFDDPLFDDEAGSLYASLECDSGNEFVLFNTYHGFTRRAAMDRVYDGLVGDISGQPVRSEEGNCPSDGTWDIGGTDVGRVACYYFLEDPNDPAGTEGVARVWTYDDGLVLGYAHASSEDVEALRDWWSQEAGPLAEPEKVVGLAGTSPRQVRAAEKRLRSQIPHDNRPLCEALDREEEDAFGPFTPRRLFIRAAFYCPAVESVSFVTDEEFSASVLYASVSPAVIDAFFLNSKVFQDPPVDADCPGDSTWYVHSEGKTDDLRTVGEVSCYAAGEGTADEGVIIRWTHRDQGFFGEAAIVGGDFETLHSFWEQEGGPLLSSGRR